MQNGEFIMSVSNTGNLDENMNFMFIFEEDEKAIYIELESEEKVTILRHYLELYKSNNKNKLYIKTDEQQYFTLVSFKESIFSFNNKRYYKIIADEIFIGSSFQRFYIENIDRIIIDFGSFTDEKMNQILTNIFNRKTNFLYYKCNISCNGMNIRINKLNCKIKELDFRRELNYFFEVFYILYGFVPKVKKIKYTYDLHEIYQYPDMSKLYLTKTRYIRPIEGLVDIKELDRLQYIVTKYKKLKKHLGYTLFSGMMLAQSSANPINDISLANIIQTLDNFTFEKYKPINKKSEVIEVISKFIKNYKKRCKKLKEGNVEVFDGISSTLGNLKNSESLSNRLRNIMKEDITNKVFYLEEKIKKTNSECSICKNKEWIVKNVYNTRVKFSHMCDKNLELLIKHYPYLQHKFILVLRIELIKLLNLYSSINLENLEKNISSIQEQLIDESICIGCKNYIKYSNENITNKICKYQ